MDKLRYQLFTPFRFKRQPAVFFQCNDVELFLDLAYGPVVVGSDQPDDVAADHGLELRRRSLGDDLPVVDDGDAVAVLRFLHIVGRHEDRDLFALPQLRDELPDGVPRLRVQADGRLVQEQHARIVEEPPGDLKSPLHAAGEIFNEVVLAVRELDDFEHLVDPFVGQRPVEVVEIGVELEVLVCREPGVEGRVLKDDADGGPDLVGVLGTVVSRDRGGAGRCRQERAEDVDRRGLARAVRSEKPEDLAFIYGEGDVVDGFEGFECLS